MDRRNPSPPFTSGSIDLTCTDSSEDEEKKESSLIPAIDLTSMLDDNNSDVDGMDVSKEENGKIQRKRRLQSEQSISSSSSSSSSSSWKKSATSSTRNAANNLKTTGLLPEDILEVNNDSNNKHKHQPCYWSCPRCTCNNSMDFERCDACLYHRCSLKKPPPLQAPDPDTSRPLFATATATATVSPDRTSISASSSTSFDRNSDLHLPSGFDSSSSSSSSSSPCYRSNTGDSLPSSKKKNNCMNDTAPDTGEKNDSDNDDGYDSWGKGNWCFLLPNNDKDHPSTTTATSISSSSNAIKMGSSTNDDDQENKKPTPDLQTSRGNNTAATNITVEAAYGVMKDDEQEVTPDNEAIDDRDYDDDDDDDDSYDSWGIGNWCFLLPNKKDKYHPSTTATIISINSNVVRMKISTNYDDEDSKKPTPDLLQSSRSNNNATTSITMEAIDKVMKDNEQDVKVKKEGTAIGLTTKEREKRKRNFDIWKTANTDPDDGLGRYVFRRGCHPRCITTILGGSGCFPFPVVDKPKTAFLQNPTMQNPFIEPGEFYVAGNEGFNPFGPRFPGDTGCVDTRAFGQNSQQDEFHLFVQCASQSHKRLWHGKNARDGRLYVVSYSCCCCLLLLYT